jgi:hypothetical protein
MFELPSDKTLAVTQKWPLVSRSSGRSGIGPTELKRIQSHG